MKACLICKRVGADFVKTSTGFNKAGATLEHVRLMRQTVGDDMGVKAAGGIRDLETALAGFVGLEAVTVLPDGYSANLAAAEGLAVDHDLAIVDARCHTSMFEAATGAGMSVVRYEHLDPASAASAARAHNHQRVAIFTDGVFAAHGALAPLPQLLEALPANGTLVVDDCHGGEREHQTFTIRDHRNKCFDVTRFLTGPHQPAT